MKKGKFIWWNKYNTKKKYQMKKIKKNSLQEGLLTTSRYYHGNNNSNNKILLNGKDYIVLNEKDLNKEFDIKDVEINNKLK